MAGETIRANWYDHADIYDIAFGWDTTDEIAFFERVFGEFSPGGVRTVFEPFCGGGRLLIPLAQRGYRVSGCDLNERMLAVLRKRAGELSLDVEVRQCSAADWRAAEPVDAVVTLIDSFRYVVDDGELKRTLAAFRNGLRAGGLLVLGVSVGPQTESKWTMERAGTTVTTTVNEVDAPESSVLKIQRSRFDVREADGREYAVECEERMRGYTFGSLCEAVMKGGFEFVAAYDWNKRFQALDGTDFAGSVVGVFRA